ncbi:MAG: sulfite exporter TauE/SafE family protein [Bacteroidales bacterium]|nr:sulfite exporter TauE/SafE family protein [Bacteroidales bacterium]
MTQDINVLALTAASIGFFHTLLGPDHYLPFIVMAKARKWSIFKTSWITFLCGLGHVASSILIGAIGIAAGIGVSQLEGLEAERGNIAAWLFMGFGLIYFVWGLWRGLKNKPHTHLHHHAGGVQHEHHHEHAADHDHTHQGPKMNLTPWILFLIFVLGPCEPLIPVLMYPAAKQSIGGTVLIAGIFAVVTIVTMMGVVLLLTYGIKHLSFGKLERYTHAIAGAIIFLSGFAISFLGL